MLQIVMEITVLLIMWEYLDCQKDPEEREHWFTVIPRNDMQDTANSVLCEWYWSEDFDALIYC